jgi:hypothetical protein
MQQWVMVADSVVDQTTGAVKSALPKEVLNSPYYNGQLTVLLVTFTPEPPIVTTTTTTFVPDTTTTPAPNTTTEAPVSTTPVRLNQTCF